MDLFLEEEGQSVRMVLFFQSLGQKSKMKIKILRTDNGSKYESNEFNDYFREVDIKREITIAYTPEQNRVAERKN